MDYCHPCRRHLNGALACPGCGAPAQQLRAYPPAAYEPEPEPYALEPYTQEPEPYPRDASAHESPGDPDGRGDHDDHDDDDRDDHDDRGVDAGEPQGRAARRRGQGRGARRGPEGTAGASDASRRDRKASAHRRRRRRVVLITAGFVLAAGGLSLAELGVDAPGFSSPHNPEVAGGESSEVDGEAGKVPEPSASAQPLDHRTAPGGATASSSPSSSASPSASESAKDGKATRSPGKEAQSATLAPSSGSTTPSDPDSGSNPTPTAAPTTIPQPSPTETCTRFLWWCS